MAIVLVPACFNGDDSGSSSSNDNSGCQGNYSFEWPDASVAPPPRIDAPGPTGDGGDGGLPCATGEVCTTEAPNGIYFVDSAMQFPMLGGAFYSQPTPQLVIGGTDDVTIDLRGSDGSVQPMTLPFVPQLSTPPLLTVQGVVGEVVSLLAGSDGSSELDIIDPTTQTLLGRRTYETLPIGQTLAVPTREVLTGVSPLTTEASSFVFAAGDETIGFALLDQSGMVRLVDTSTVLTLTGATQTAWDTLHIPAATPGHYTVAIQPLGQPLTAATFDVVDHADALGVTVDLGGLACFEATSNGTFIAGLTWTFTVAGAVVPSAGIFGPNCVGAPANNGSTFTVTATAGGQSLTITTTAP